MSIVFAIHSAGYKCCQLQWKSSGEFPQKVSNAKGRKTVPFPMQPCSCLDTFFWTPPSYGFFTCFKPIHAIISYLSRRYGDLSIRTLYQPNRDEHHVGEAYFQNNASTNPVESLYGLFIDWALQHVDNIASVSVDEHLILRSCQQRANKTDDHSRYATRSRQKQSRAVCDVGA